MHHQVQKIKIKNKLIIKTKKYILTFKINFIFGQVLNPFWHNFYALGQVFIVVNGQIL